MCAIVKLDMCSERQVKPPRARGPRGGSRGGLRVDRDPGGCLKRELEIERESEVQEG